jgi:outer membrane protein assembly factor BamE (lipoprotein component of BamABCDE complex)
MKLLAVTIALLLAGCLQHTTHQGNVLKPGAIAQIEEGDTRLHVETLLGTPVLKDVLHPGYALYVEHYDNPDTGERYTRGIEVHYDKAWRVESVRVFGFQNAAGNPRYGG